MLLGFLDGRGRAYDLSFRTTKLRMLDADGELELRTGETVRGEGRLEASLLLERGDRWAVLLRPVPGTLVRTSERIVFLGDSDLARKDPRTTFFNVQLPVSVTAVRHLLEAESGREFLAVPLEEVAARSRTADALVVTVDATDVTRPSNRAAYRLELRPAADAEDVLA